METRDYPISILMEVGVFNLPLLHVLYNRSAHGYTGKATIETGDEVTNCSHVITVEQSDPLGAIRARVDPEGNSHWASAEFPGAGITERDLQWATCWASQCIKQKHEAHLCREALSSSGSTKFAIK